MPESQFDILKAIIHHRHTVKPALMNGKIIPDEQMQAVLALADEAPNHGRTEPWRFYVFSGERREQFGRDHAAMYKEYTPEAEFEQKKSDSLAANAAKASHVVLAAMKRGHNPKIPAIEEYAATAASIENVLLGATAMGLASMWNTGGMTHYPPMKTYLGLGEEDEVLAILYFGYTDENVQKPVRKVSLTEKIIWNPAPRG